MGRGGGVAINTFESQFLKHASSFFPLFFVPSRKNPNRVRSNLIQSFGCSVQIFTQTRTHKLLRKHVFSSSSSSLLPVCVIKKSTSVNI